MVDEKQSQPSSGFDPLKDRPKWMRWMGLRRRQGRFIKLVPTFWHWVALGVLFLAGNAAFMEYSMQPDFCRSCHLMEPYYRAWHESTHKNVACPECHFEPGLANTVKGKFEASSQLAKYITGTYGSKPHAEVHDSSCLRSGCHETRVLEGKVDWTVKSTSGHDVTIKFDHTPHLTELRRGKQLRCVSCHSQMVQGKHIVVTTDSCFLCHFKGFEHGRHDETLGGCRACHDSPKLTVRLSTGDFVHEKYVDRGVSCENCHSDAIAGDGSVPRQYCWSCHNQPEQLARYGETDFLHQQHVTEHKVECTNCHTRIMHNLQASVPDTDHGAINGAAALANAGGCAQCHGGLHGGARLLYSGTGGRGVENMPSPMFRAQVDCIACHRSVDTTGLVAEFSGKTYLTTQQSCDYCHEKDYEGRLAEWKSTMDDHLARASKASSQADAALAAASSLSASKKLELQRLMDDAHTNLQLVESGRGVHNVTYSTALLNVVIENAQRVIDSTTKTTDSQTPNTTAPAAVSTR
ncbi:hypothetical protein HED60_01300 [Planctomycetales bacterium ZRK34]|nr:hypothetical protein HED60_01300 [Planctomycetales bacterium ZRK34]